VPGMNSGLSPGDPVLIAAFRSALLHQGVIALIMIVFLGLVWATARAWPASTPAGEGATGEGPVAAGAVAAGAVAAGNPEPRGRWLLRTGFGVLWIFDGLLQAQPKMAGGLATQVIEPVAASSPAWVQHLVNWGGTIWSYHPVEAGAASVWIQIGIGAWLIAAGGGAWSRLPGAASVAWGLIVWVFGESFGGIFAPGLSWLTGAPGGVLCYVAAGALIALPQDAWRSPRSGRWLLAGLGVFFAGMAVLQAWPGRGSWQGGLHGKPGPLAGMVRDMAATPQPHVLSALLSGFASFVARHGFAVNLVVVLTLAGLGALFLTGRPRLVRYAVRAGIVFCLATWLLVQDLGFLGGLGTDPNSMIPLILLFSAGYLALTPAPQEAPEAVTAGPGAGGWRPRLRPEALGRAVASARWQGVAAAGALAVIVLGAAPMAAAAADRTADPILALAIAGDSSRLDLPAPGFSLTDQAGRTVSLDSLRGKVVLMTFLDPVCTTDCPVIAQELKQAGQMLGAQDARVELVAVVANPVYRSVAFTRAFDRQEGLASVPNWLYLTGSLSQLRPVWRHYGVEVENLPAGAMAAHNDLAVVIDAAGHIRREMGADPGPATGGTRSSFAVLLSQYARDALGPA
jgi:cytochrome oxidase Cu insertion factor (SCO1/SenC/PrrC family)